MFGRDLGDILGVLRVIAFGVSSRDALRGLSEELFPFERHIQPLANSKNVIITVQILQVNN